MNRIEIFYRGINLIIIFNINIFLEKQKLMYSAYNLVPVSLVDPFEYYNGLFEQMSYQLKQQNQEICQLKK